MTKPLHGATTLTMLGAIRFLLEQPRVQPGNAATNPPSRPFSPGRAATAEFLKSTDYGTQYAIIGALADLNGRVAEIVTVWIMLAGDDVPRFVTAYPKD